MKEQDIIEQAFFYLKGELGNKLKWKQPHQQVPHAEYDALFTLEGKALYVEAKNEVRPNQVERLLHLKAHLGDVVIVANYITPTAKKLLREKQVNYLDRAGNTWFRMGPVYIHIEGLHNQPPAEDRRNRAFTKTGIKVVFQILNTPELINATYRDIVDITGVALGTVPKVIEGLKEEGFLLKKTENEWIIKDYDELLNRWQNEYLKKLKPALFVKRYRPKDQDFYINWKNLDLNGRAQWGGEPAGDLLTRYLRPEVFTLYTNQLQQEIMKKYKWVPDPGGDIYVYKQFWKVNNELRAENCVPATLVYADLMETGDSRCIEMATMIYDRYLRKH